jgi:hypothetical protein
MADQKLDPELEAISTLLSALESLDVTARQNVVDYVFKRLKISAPTVDHSDPAHTNRAAAVAKPAGETPHAAAHLADIRSFKEQKAPKSASEMAAVVAYYCAHLSPTSERRDYITAKDITKFFFQASFPLPSSSAMALVHAKNAGYLDAQQRGRYRLNPVGHNLVVHRLPGPTNSTNAQRPRSIRKRRNRSGKSARARR